MNLAESTLLKRLTNKSEHRVFEQVAKASEEFGAEVYQKIRVADVIDIDKCSTREIGAFALMSHFDFVVTGDDQFPQFAIEFDGDGHSSKNDWKKDELCKQANLALFRVNLLNLNSEVQDMNFLVYLVHCWFMAHEFEKMRQSGQIAFDEPFMMWGFLKPNAKHLFDSDYEFTAQARSKIARLNREHQFLENPMMASPIGHLTLSRDFESFASFTCIAVRNENVFGLAKMDLKIPCFGSLADIPFGAMALADFCDGMAHRSLVDNLELYLNGAGHTLTPESEVKQHIGRLKEQGFKVLHGGGIQGHALGDQISI